ncbi:hypothetical protein GQ600_5631 [Phytophthora cactorum]|nr:hypothetical protein GQ600_5631 [Phytophthora cactorum]
MWYGAD